MRSQCILPKGLALVGMTGFVVLINAASMSHAAFVTPTGWTRGSGNSTYQGWDIFSSPAGPNTPDLAGKFPTTTTFAGAITPNAYDTSGASFVTSGGNIYSPTAASHIVVDLPGYNGTTGGSLTTILLQTRTQGSETVYTGVNAPRVTYNSGSGPTTIFAYDMGPTYSTPLGGFGGNLVDRSYLFHLPADPASFRIELDAASSSMSLDQIYVDTFVTTMAQGYAAQPVPEPASLGAFGIGAMIGLLARRRRQSGRA